MLELANTDVTIFRDPITHNAIRHRWWADRGLVHWENSVTGEYGSQSVFTTLIRLQAIQEMINNSRTEKGYMRPDDVAEYSSYIDKMIIICKKAKVQGMPDDANHAKQKMADFKAKRHSRLVIMPGERRTISRQMGV